MASMDSPAVTQLDADLHAAPASTILGRAATGGVGALTVAQATDLLSAIPRYSQLATGQTTCERFLASSASATTLSTGVIRLTAFTATRSQVATSVTLFSGSTAAAATPSLCKIGLYQVGGTGQLSDDLTLLAVTASDTGLFAAQNTQYDRNFATPTTLTAGIRYAIGVLVVTGATAPTLTGPLTVTISSALFGITPWVTAAVIGQSDIAGDITSTLVTSGGPFYAAVTP